MDSLIPPPSELVEKKPKFSSNSLAENRFELVYNSACEEQEVQALFKGTDSLKVNYAELEKDQDELFDDDGI